MELNDVKYVLLLGLFVTSLTSANYLAAKIVILGNFNGIFLLVPAGVIAYAVTFTITDIISEVYGKRAASIVVFIGFVTQLLIPIYSYIAVLMPTASFQQEYTELFNRVFSVAPNIVIASLIAYLISQNHDIWAFHWWRRLTQGRHLWLRNNASTMMSQLIDTTIFITMAFGVLPSIFGGVLVSWDLIPFMILGQYIVKVIIALLDTPFVYLGVMTIKGEIKIPFIRSLRGGNNAGNI